MALDPLDEDLSLTSEVEDLLVGLELDPLAFVLTMFPWGEEGTSLADQSGPEPWQRQVLATIRDELGPDDPLQIAAAAGRGVGKSALISWLILWSMTTRANSRGRVTANTEKQLRTVTWPEVAKWFSLFALRDYFALDATTLRSRDSRRREWRFDMMPWSSENIVAFQGLHNKGNRLTVVFDEGSGIDDAIFEAIQGSFTDAGTQKLWFVGGNPNKPTGYFRQCFEGGKFSRRWRSFHVDSREVSFTDKKTLDGWIQDYGLDSDYIRVNVRGTFPRNAPSGFIPLDLVWAAQARPADALLAEREPLVLGVDVARFGDDRSVLWPRRGLDARTLPPLFFEKLDTFQLAEEVQKWALLHRPDAIFIDGGGVGGGVIDTLRRHFSVDALEVQFGSSPLDLGLEGDHALYANKRAEMWGAMRQWLRRGSIPEDKDLRPNRKGEGLSDELGSAQYGIQDKTGRILLVSKQDMRRLGLVSPDAADALALTFAWPVTPRHEGRDARGRRTDVVVRDYDPIAQYERELAA